jgi:hypothetical protein
MNNNHDVLLAKAERYSLYLQKKYQKLAKKPTVIPSNLTAGESLPAPAIVPENDTKHDEKKEIVHPVEPEAPIVEKKKFSVNDYESLAVIGRGAFGEVRLVRRKGNDHIEREVYGK